VALHLGKNLLCILGFAAYHILQVMNQDFLQSTAHDGMIIGNQNPDHVYSPAWLESGSLGL
jgi:hypothetical protein